MCGYPSSSDVSFSGSCSLCWTMRVAKPPQRMPAVNSCFDHSKCEGCLGGSLSVLNFGKIKPSTQDSPKPGLAYAVQGAIDFRTLVHACILNCCRRRDSEQFGKPQMFRGEGAGYRVAQGK